MYLKTLVAIGATLAVAVGGVPSSATAHTSNPQRDHGDPSIVVDLTDSETIIDGFRVRRDGLGTDYEKYFPQYELPALKTSLEGYGQYRDPDRAFNTFSREHPQDLNYIKNLCALPPLTIANVEEYETCTDALFWEYEISQTEQFTRVSEFVAFLASSRDNKHVADTIRAFNLMPTRSNFNNIEAAGTNHTTKVLDPDNSYFDRINFPGKVEDFGDPWIGIRSFRPTILPEYGNLDSAIHYARTYATKPNPAYPYYDGHDCANFVSQILESAGKKRTSTWAPGKRGWINAYQLSRSIDKPTYYKDFGTMAKKALVGHVLFFDRHGNKQYTHSGFVVGKKATNIEIAQHSNNYVAWTNGRASGWKYAQGWGLSTW